jgi:hypothetical protein
LEATALILKKRKAGTGFRLIPVIPKTVKSEGIAETIETVPEITKPLETRINTR